MKKAYILHHLGLGDHITCNGLYRFLSEKYDQLILPVKRHNYLSITRMLSDLSNVQIKVLSNEGVTPEEDMVYYGNMLINYDNLVDSNNMFDIIRLGDYDSNFEISDDCRFDEVFYKQMNIPFIESWSKFEVPRDVSAEKNIFNILCGRGNEGRYIFLHEDSSRKDILDRGLINTDMPIITPGINEYHHLGDDDGVNFFDYRYILENANEIHCIESSFSIFIDRIETSAAKYLHRYTRYNQAPPTLKNSWNIFE